ncbi:cobalamin binding intrinsic factor-like [Pempheris klunzingeri]|uniref:cobalamin binding intrinsic factor-like n=1 Tax=Pempheris klunzingeri TaxID=3127111 RepID=UPI00397F3609
MKTPALLSAALLLLLLLLLPGVPAAGSGQTPINVLVTNSVTNSPNKTYSTYVVYRGILLGGLRRLQESNTGFTFTYTEDPNYGPFLESVNGLAGSPAERTYWELLVSTTGNQIIRPDVGIGCYIPSANEQIILNYNEY